MDGFSNNNIMGVFSKEEILYTYRKVKRELYNEKENIYLEDIVTFEENIFENIEFLLNILNSNSNFLLNEFINKKENIGSPNFIFKSIKIEEKENLKVKKTAENFQRELFDFNDVDFRFTGTVSVFFQVIGGLWLNRIGYKLDQLFPDNIYGCRLKRFDEDLVDLPYYKQNHSLYKPYYNDYRKWQNDLFDKIEFLKNKDIVVITSDLKKYYHSIEVQLLKNVVNKLITENKINVSNHDILLNDLLFDMINKFNEINNSSYLDFFEENKLNHKEFGLPLTLNVSRVLANIYLLDFDKDIIQNVKPIYYGRYVDDLIIAVEYNSDKDNLSFKKVLSSLKKFRISEDGKLTSVKKDNFNLYFNATKENIFLFNNNKDKVELNHIRKTINKSSSEWKLLPDTSDYDDKNDLDLFQSINNECIEVNSLRKSSGLILKRNKFIKEILSFESDIKNFDKKTWSKRLDNFLNVTFDFIFDIQNFIDLNKYIPRLFGLLINSDNNEIIKNFIDELSKVLLLLEHKTSNADNITNMNKFYIAKEFIYKKIHENLICHNALDKINNEYILRLLSYELIISNEFLNNVVRYFNTDLHIIPFKNCYFKYEEYVEYIVSSLDENEVDFLTSLFFNPYLKDFIGNKTHSNKCDCKYNDCNKFCFKIFDGSGFYFYTRRISLLELSVAFKNNVLTDYYDFSELAKRYYHKFTINFKDHITHQFIDFNETVNKKNPRVCNTHFLTNNESFDAMVRQLTEPDLNRYDRLTKIVNDIIKNKEHIDYVVFHELSLPRHYYIQIAEKLGFVNINLISGLEYKIDNQKNIADNQLIYVLKVDNKSAGSIALYQSKNVGAIHENSEIYNKAGLQIEPRYKNKLIIKHNDFIFSGMICNDLLDINNRSFLRGNIDALFVIAWNQDIETYQHLVKSATLDIHCYVSLCNNKKYGDTRIRAPYKEEWKRDMQKIHGGELDNFMVSELNIKELRDFQSNKVPPRMPFKPFPTGFEISKERKKK